MSASAIARCASPVVVVVVVVVVVGVGGWLVPLAGCPLKPLDADPAQPAETSAKAYVNHTSTIRGTYVELLG